MEVVGLTLNHGWRTQSSDILREHEYDSLQVLKTTFDLQQGLVSDDHALFLEQLLRTIAFEIPVSS